MSVKISGEKYAMMYGRSYNRRQGASCRYEPHY